MTSNRRPDRHAPEVWRDKEMTKTVMKGPINRNGAEGLTVEEVRRILANPFYCVNISEAVAMQHELMISEEEWIKAAVQSINEIGVENFLRELLENLKGNYV
jgi:hypothetical protein